MTADLATKILKKYLGPRYVDLFSDLGLPMPFRSWKIIWWIHILKLQAVEGKWSGEMVCLNVKVYGNDGIASWFIP